MHPEATSLHHEVLRQRILDDRVHIVEARNRFPDGFSHKRPDEMQSQRTPQGIWFPGIETFQIQGPALHRGHHEVDANPAVRVRVRAGMYPEAG
jgi:hypothetical protein